MPTMEKGDALLIVDVQRDFLPGGRLGVPDGDAMNPGGNNGDLGGCSAGTGAGLLSALALLGLRRRKRH